MGKKNKSQKASSASSSLGPPGPPGTVDAKPLRQIRYCDMPENHKRRYRIFDEYGSRKKYVETIGWLRAMCTYDGADFLGIWNSNWSGDGYPLVEVEVFTPEGLSAKFLFSKSSMCLVAFSTKNGLFQFNQCEFDVLECTSLEKFKGNYIGRPWRKIGPKTMIDAVTLLATNETLDSSNTLAHVKAVEVFMFHFSEATRLYVVQSLVCKSLEHNQDLINDNKDVYEDEATRTLCDLDKADDVYSLVEDKGYLNMDEIEPPSYLEDLVKKYSSICKVWYTYALTNKRFFDLRPSYVSRFHIRSVKSLRCILGILCNTNLDNLLPVLRKKIGKDSFTLADYKKIEGRIRDLQANRRIQEKNQGEEEKKEKGSKKRKTKT